MCDKYCSKTIYDIITHILGPGDKVGTTVELATELCGVLVTMTGGGANGGACDPRLLAGGRDEIMAPGGTVVLVITGDERGGLAVGTMAGLGGEEVGGMMSSDAKNACQVRYTHVFVHITYTNSASTCPGEQVAEVPAVV